MRKVLRSAAFSVLVSLFLSLCVISFASSSSRASASVAHTAFAHMVTYESGRGWSHGTPWGHRPFHHWFYGAPQINNQYFSGSGNSGNVTRSTGHNQTNTGNQGLNRGALQDNSLNAGNQFMNRHEPRGLRISNQYFWGRGNANNISIFRGYNQQNSGNEGYNKGIVQDNSNNSGNQIIN